MKLLISACVLILASSVLAGCGGLLPKQGGNWADVFLQGNFIAFSKSSEACGMSVPIPSGFLHRSWRANGENGFTISDGAIAPSDPALWTDDANQVVLAVYWGGVYMGPAGTLHNLQFPLALHEFDQGSGDIPFWADRGLIDNGKGVCGIAVWLGPHAPAADRSALSALQAIKPN